MADQITRRRFLEKSGVTAVAGGAVLAGSTSPRPVRAAVGANDRIGLALIGCGRRGVQLLEVALQLADLAFPMVCDVDEHRAAAVADRIEKAGKPRPATVGDFHRVLERDDVHGVIIATPDHWHAVQLMHACIAGKDVYVEAPVSHSAMEGIAMIAATRRRHRVVQTGLQRRAGTWFEQAVKQIRANRIGRVAQTRSWTFFDAAPIDRTEDGKQPAHLDYDRWLGPAPRRRYNPARVAGHRNWWDYGGGTMALWNVHMMDVVHWAMRINSPLSVSAVGGNMGLKDFRETPDTLEAVFEYRNAGGPFMHVYSLRMNNGHAVWGPPQPVTNRPHGSPESPHVGTQFHGDRGTLFVDRAGASLLTPAAKQAETIDKPVIPEGAESIDLLTVEHVSNFVDCMRTRAEPRAPIEAGHYAALACHLANIAYRLGRKIYYEPNQHQCFADAKHEHPDRDADALLFRQARKPYMLPAV